MEDFVVPDGKYSHPVMSMRWMLTISCMYLTAYGEGKLIFRYGIRLLVDCAVKLQVAGCSKVACTLLPLLKSIFPIITFVRNIHMLQNNAFGKMTPHSRT